jgi:hypothetical protein
VHNDLVKELRYYCDCTDTMGKCFYCECADEIERLRKMVGQSRSWVTFDEEYRA